MDQHLSMALVICGIAVLLAASGFVVKGRVMRDRTVNH